MKKIRKIRILDLWDWMTLNSVMALNLRYFNEFVVPVGCRRKTVHVRYLISW